MVIASAHWDSCVHFLHHFSPETPEVKTPMAIPGKTQEVFDMWKMVCINLENLPKNTNKNNSNIQLPPHSNKKWYKYTFRKWVLFQGLLVGRFFPSFWGARLYVEKIRCFLAPESRSHSGWVRVLTVPRCFLDGSWWLPPRYLEDPGIPESSLVCKICARFFHFFTRKKP